NPDDHVRYWAALTLAEDGVTESTPAILDVWNREKVPETRTNMALALAQLGEHKGFVALTEVCRSADSSSQLRIYAAKYLLDLQNEECLDAVIQVFESETDTAVRVLALSQLPRFHQVTKADSKRIAGVAASALENRAADVRVAASDTLSML